MGHSIPIHSQPTRKAIAKLIEKDTELDALFRKLHPRVPHGASFYQALAVGNTRKKRTAVSTV
jgi:hypothetical protein